jgi:hypothetical protein
MGTTNSNRFLDADNRRLLDAAAGAGLSPEQIVKESLRAYGNGGKNRARNGRRNGNGKGSRGKA